MHSESVPEKISSLITDIRHRLPSLETRFGKESDDDEASTACREIKADTLEHLRAFARMLDTRVGPSARRVS